MKNLSKYYLPMAIIALTLTTTGVSISIAETGKASALSGVVDSAGSLDGIGALGRIEPRSRVIRLSHDQGMEGAYISEILVKEGQRVKTGDVLVVFGDRNRRQSEVDIAKARQESALTQRNAYAAQKDIAAITFRRAEKLIKDNAIAKADYDAAKANLTKATADLQTAEHAIQMALAEVELGTKRLAQSTVTSPIDATILKIYRFPGERAGDTQIMDIADLRSLDIVAEIYESDFPRIAVGQKAVVRITGDNTEHQATVRETGFMVQKNDLNNTDPLADRDNRVVEVRLSLAPESVEKLHNQIFRQVQVQIFP